MAHADSIQQLIKALGLLPGVGKKSATRMAYYLLQKNQSAAEQISSAIGYALENIRPCENCYLLSDQVLCPICSNTSRDSSKLCVVGSHSDVFAVEKSAIYDGLYFVLGGNLSPLDGIGPQQLHLPELFNKVHSGTCQEIILATNTTVEGEGTANYILDSLQDCDISISRIAYGVPIGGELDYVSGTTLGHAFSDRKRIR